MALAMNALICEFSEHSSDLTKYTGNEQQEIVKLQEIDKSLMINQWLQELPFSFVKEHGDKLQERVTLLGASDHLRVVDLRVTTFEGQGRVHLGKGWKEFSLENRFSEGGVLLFSLVGVSTFVVKMFRRSDD